MTKKIYLFADVETTDTNFDLKNRSDDDMHQLQDIITTLVINDIQFTKTLKRLNFELLY
jgi:hypothetical protein